MNTYEHTHGQQNLKMEWWIKQEKEKKSDGGGNVVKKKKKKKKNKSVTIAQSRLRQFFSPFFPPSECVGGGAEAKAQKERLIKSAVDVWDR